MSKLFFDHLIDLKKLNRVIKDVAHTEPERNELWKLVDEIVHKKVLECILDNLPEDKHDRFLIIYHERPYDTLSIFEYLKSEIGANFEELIRQELGILESELISQFAPPKA